jgi:hypothetical protein
MDQGHVAESGKHWDLMMQKGLYYALQVRQMLPEELRDLELQMDERRREAQRQVEAATSEFSKNSNNI